MKKFLSLAALFIFFTSSVFGKFTDEDSIPEWGKESIGILSTIEVFGGNEDGSFTPFRLINRAEFCKLIVLGTKTKKYIPLEPSFVDTEIGDWFFSYVETAKNKGWIQGYDDKTFRPGQKINRAEVAKILTIAFEFEVPKKKPGQEWYEPYFYVLSDNDLLAYGSSWENLEPAKEPTRVEVAEQVFRFMKKTGKISSFDLAKYNIELDADDEDVISPEDNNLNDNDQDTSQLPEIQTPSPVTDPQIPMFDYNSDNNTEIQSLDINVNAGSLYISKLDYIPKKLQVSPNQKNQTLHGFQLVTKKGPVKINALQIRRIGKGKHSDFSKIWLEVNGRVFSKKETPMNDIIQLEFNSLFTVSTIPRNILIKGDISENAKKENSSRFTLFLPEWIDADTKSKIGFFPLGGVDIIIEE